MHTVCCTLIDQIMYGYNNLRSKYIVRTYEFE